MRTLANPGLSYHVGSAEFLMLDRPEGQTFRLWVPKVQADELESGNLILKIYCLIAYIFPP